MTDLVAFYKHRIRDERVASVVVRTTMISDRVVVAHTAGLVEAEDHGLNMPRSRSQTASGSRRRRLNSADAGMCFTGATS
jgi:hypothetical protein